MSEISFRVSAEEQTLLSESVGGLVADMREGIVTPQEFQDIARILQVNRENFEEFKAETWFKKSWLVLSGRRGKLTDITIANLGKVQVGVLKLLGEVLEDTSGIKDDLLSVFGQLDHIQEQSLELKSIILKFNEKYDRRFKKLQKEIEQTRWSLRVSQAVLGVSCFAGALLFFIPGVAEKYWHFGVAGGGVAGTLFLGLALGGAVKRKKSPVPLAAGKNIPLESEGRHSIAQACEFLGLDRNIKDKYEDLRVFKVNKEVKDVIDYFKLSGEEQRLLFSLEYYLCNIDREKTVEHESRKNKALWLDSWQKIIESQLSAPLVTDTDELYRRLDEVRNEHLPMQKIGIILFEAALFTPYFPLSTDQKEVAFKYDQIDRREQIAKLCRTLALSNHLIEETEKIYTNALKEIPAKGLMESIWGTIKENPFLVLTGAVLIAITGGLAAPYIGGIVGASMGLSGVAAVNAGLAFLGGGAIAAGGMGMAGGTAVLIGGGAMLGGGTACGLANLFSGSKHLVVRELAKMEAISFVLFSILPDGKKVIQKIIEHEKETRGELARAQELAKTNKEPKKVKELEEGIGYCSKAIARLEEFVKKHL